MIIIMFILTKECINKQTNNEHLASKIHAVTLTDEQL